ncbi:MAG: type II toxin-antitoxin system HicB family antitoxin [Gammaproteobacteria bacterium]|nr:type II toxin-antitoxin system HicB family antitoxin [Gammaproteobacteria bacterium]NNJ84070.1 type II toxin-antitoxin system HicB family antitoxin [Gammaproteobacteria bacterium]
MNNVMNIEGHTAIISFDPELNQFRGQFTGLNGGADFYADSVDALREEGACSLKTFLSVCKERNIEPYKTFSGKFVVRVPANLHARVTEAAGAAGISLNQWVQQALQREVHT